MARTDDDEAGDIFHPEPVPRRRTSAGRTLAVVAVALLVATLLDADGLHQTAEHQKPGTARNVGLWLTEDVAQPISHWTGLNRPRQWINSALGIPNGTHITDTKHVKLAPRTTQPSVGQPTTTTTTLALRTPTPVDPLKVLVTGDSLSEDLFPPLVSAENGKPVMVKEDSQIGTGLARPDVIDWPTRLGQDMRSSQCDVVVVMFGGNDAQDLRTADGWVYIRDSAAWQLEYERRVALVMDTMIKANPKVSIIWVGMPAMTSGPKYLPALYPAMNSIFQREAAARPANAHYVDAGSVLDAPGGGFQAYATNPDGTSVKIRASDGVHFTEAGGTRIIDQLVAPVISRLYSLP